MVANPAIGGLPKPLPVGGTIELLQRQVLTTTAAAVTFSNIDQNFEHLRLEIEARSADTAGIVVMQFNGDTGSNYQWSYSQITNGSATEGTSSSQTSVRASNLSGPADPAGYASSGTVRLHGYARTTFNKVYTGQNWQNVSGEGTILLMLGGMWVSTAAITRIALSTGGTGFVAGSVFSLYGER